MTVCDPLTRNVRAQRAHSDLSPAGRGKTASASTSADPALIAGQQLQLFGTIGRCVQKAFVGSHCCGGPAFRISVKAAIRIPKSYPGALRFNQCVFSLGPQLREQPLVILIQPGILTSCFSKHAIDHLRRNPIRLGNAGGICLRHFSVGRSNRSTAQKKSPSRSRRLPLSAVAHSRLFCSSTPGSSDRSVVAACKHPRRAYAPANVRATNHDDAAVAG